MLPKDLFFLICQYLGYYDILNFCHSNLQYVQYCNDKSLWNQVLDFQFGEVSDDPKKVYLEKYSNLIGLKANWILDEYDHDPGYIKAQKEISQLQSKK